MRPTFEPRFEFNMVAGTYCGGIEARGTGTVIFDEGIYVLRGDGIETEVVNNFDGRFDIRANVALEGSNTAFVLNGIEAYVNWGGSADVKLWGRTEDPLKGFLFYADHYATGETSPSGGHLLRGTPNGGYGAIPESW